MPDLTTMMPWIIGAIVFVAVAGLVSYVAMAMRGQSAQEKRLENIMKGRSSQMDMDLAEERYIKDNDKAGTIEQFVKRLPSLQKLFEQADVNIQPSALFSIGLLLAFGGAVVAWIMKIPVFLLPIPALVMFTLPFFWLLNKRRTRLKKFASQLPDALELVARALRAGHALAAGMKVVADEMPDPIAKEFGQVYAEQNLGLSLEEALKNMCERVPNLDLRFFVTSVNIQRQTGGDLAEILDKIGYIIRERFRILGQVKALTGEGRFSGVVLIAMPFALFFVVMHLNYEYAKLLWTTDQGVRMSLIALGLQLVGALIIKKIVNIKV